MCMNGLHVENERFFIPSGKSSLILIFDMEEEAGYVEQVGVNMKGAIDMCKVKDIILNKM